MIFLALRPKATAEPSARAYRLAAQTLLTDSPLRTLSAFELESVPEAREIVPAESRAKPRQSLFSGAAWLAGATQHVECRWGDCGYWLRIGNSVTWSVAADGTTIRCPERPAGVSTEALEEMALGPCLLLALALRGTFCLHASAVRGAGGAVAFLGSSGSGKSTLAAGLERSAEAADWSRLSDDLLPVRLDESGPCVLPHFPQLKLPALEQPSRGLPETIELAAIYVLNGGAEPGRGIESRVLSPRAAVAALARHTVAARLFAPELLARHFSFSAELVSRVPVRSLSYPWSGEVWRGVTALLEVDRTGGNWRRGRDSNPRPRD